MSVTWVSTEPHDLCGPLGKNLLASSSFYSPGWLVAPSLQSPQDIVQSVPHIALCLTVPGSKFSPFL